MHIKNEISTDEINKEGNTFSGHGILTLPLCVMLPFGLLGFKTGQLFNKIAGFVINLMFLFNCGLVLAITIARLCNEYDYDRTQVKFITGFTVFVTIKFTVLFFVYFKRFNFMCLLEDITKIRKYSLSKIELTFVTMPFITMVAMTIYVIFYMYYYYVSPVIRTGNNNFVFAFEHKGTLMARVTIVLEFITYITITWISILATGLLINVISVVLRREFDKCIENLQEKIDETGILSSEIFSETLERFQELRGMVDKVGGMFFVDFTLNLSASLGMLCSSIYGIYVGHFTYQDMHLQIIISMVTLLIMLLPSDALHSKVTAIFIVLLSIYLLSLNFIK